MISVYHVGAPRYSFSKLYDEGVEKIHIEVEDIQFISVSDVPVSSVTLIKSEDM